ncbi:MAG TPA: class I SAM-dependent methyltransferase [Opitutaceae bacterium]|nr:class I SAM-dependent methyltransferase [Opitutaceae bacterium]
MGRLFGLNSAGPGKARVLEIGCGDGANLLAMADHFPEAHFLGIDPSSTQIGRAREAIAAAGLKNVEVRQQGLLDFSVSDERFDYIIAFGIYSWVALAAREKLLSTCGKHLADDGIAYVSYNALPGWNMRRSLRDMMLFHTREMPDPQAKVQQARALLAFLANSVPAEGSAYGMLLKNELTFLGNQSDTFILRDLLAKENTPFYLHEFLGAAGQHGLQYLSEPNVAEMLTSNFPEKVRETLAQLNNQLVAQEQYMDFLRNRSFRQTLLCRSTARIQRNLTTSGLSRFAFRSLVGNPAGPVELVPGMAVSFATLAGAQLTATDTFLKALLWTLSESRGVSAIGYADLLATCRTRSRPFLAEAPPDRDQVEEATLQSNLMNLLSKGLVEIYAEPVKVRAEVPDKPMVSALARHQALSARLITNRMHQPVPADLLSRFVIAACNGERTHDQITTELIARFKEGKLQISEGSQKITDEAKLKTILRPTVDAALKSLASAGFFAP